MFAVPPALAKHMLVLEYLAPAGTAELGFKPFSPGRREPVTGTLKHVFSTASIPAYKLETANLKTSFPLAANLKIQSEREAKAF